MYRADIATRFIEERARTGYSQAEFARQLDMTREGLRLNENGRSSFSAETLAKAAGLGVDVQYVLTGTPSTNHKASTGGSDSSVIVNGGTANVVQNAHAGSQINHITTEKIIHKTQAIVKQGDEHITEGQAATLKKLVQDIVDLEELTRKDPRSFRSIWAALNSHCGVTRYRLIPLDRYEKAETFLRKWIGRLSSQGRAKTVDSNWRNRKYAYIKINTKGNEGWLTSYMLQKFSCSSLTELQDTELETTYRAVSAKKKSWAKNL